MLFLLLLKSPLDLCLAYTLSWFPQSLPVALESLAKYQHSHPDQQQHSNIGSCVAVRYVFYHCTLLLGCPHSLIKRLHLNLLWLFISTAANRKYILAISILNHFFITYSGYESNYFYSSCIVNYLITYSTFNIITSIAVFLPQNSLLLAKQKQQRNHCE